MEGIVMQSMAGLAQVAAATFVSSLWQGILLAGAVALSLRLMPKISAAVRFAVWSAVFLVIVLLPFVHGYGGAVRRAASPGMFPGAMLHIDVRWSYAIAAVWALLSAIRAGKLAVSALRLHGLWKRSTPVEVDAAPVMMTGSRRVQLCTSKEIDRPSVIGFFAPRILIPEWLFEKLTPPELEQVMMHELGHISRADDWINLFQKIGLVLFPLNPVLMWIDRRLCFERELACDDGVLQCTQAPGAYAACLISMAERTLDRRAAALSLGAWERQSELSQRVHSILRRGEGMSPMRARVALGGMVFVLLGGAAGLARCPRFVSFAPENLAEHGIPMAARSLPAMGYRAAQFQSAKFQPAQVEPVAFRPEEAPHETLLKAVMPSPAGVQPAGQQRAVPPAAGAHAVPRNRVRLRAKPKFQQANQPVLVLTSWNESPDATVRSGVVLTIAGEHVHVSRYAAVSTGNGWLVFQL